MSSPVNIMLVEGKAIVDKGESKCNVDVSTVECCGCTCVSIIRSRDCDRHSLRMIFFESKTLTSVARSAP
jgi:hypothetical protein